MAKYESKIGTPMHATKSITKVVAVMSVYGGTLLCTGICKADSLSEPMLKGDDTYLILPFRFGYHGMTQNSSWIDGVYVGMAAGLAHGPVAFLGFYNFSYFQSSDITTALYGGLEFNITGRMQHVVLSGGLQLGPGYIESKTTIASGIEEAHFEVGYKNIVGISGRGGYINHGGPFVGGGVFARLDIVACLVATIAARAPVCNSKN